MKVLIDSISRRIHIRMPASQLLHILQPSIYDPDMRMKGNQDTMVYSHGDFWMESATESKEVHDERNGSVFVPFIEFERGDAAKWNPFVTSFCDGNENESSDSSETEIQNGDTVVPVMDTDASSVLSGLNEAVKDSSCKSNVVSGIPDTKDIGKETTDYVPKEDGSADDSSESSDSVSDSQNKEIHDSSEGGSVSEVPLSGQLPSLSVDGNAVDESNSEPVASDAPKLQDRKSETRNDEETGVTQIPSQIASEHENGNTEVKEATSLFAILNQEHENTMKKDSVPNQDIGERSFSTASLITYSGPVAHSGNFSMRSDGSISGRSFAFPILQSEWNSSPVRMAKADRRHYRKHRGWRSGILCCRF